MNTEAETITYLTQVLTGLGLTIDRIKEQVYAVVGLPTNLSSSFFNSNQSFILSVSSKAYHDLRIIESVLSGYAEAQRNISTIYNPKQASFDPLPDFHYASVMGSAGEQESEDMGYIGAKRNYNGGSNAKDYFSREPWATYGNPADKKSQKRVNQKLQDTTEEKSQSANRCVCPRKKIASLMDTNKLGMNKLMLSNSDSLKLLLRVKKRLSTNLQN